MTYTIDHHLLPTVEWQECFSIDSVIASPRPLQFMPCRNLLYSLACTGRYLKIWRPKVLLNILCSCWSVSCILLHWYAWKCELYKHINTVLYMIMPSMLRKLHFCLIACEMLGLNTSSILMEIKQFSRRRTKSSRERVRQITEEFYRSWS